MKIEVTQEHIDKGRLNLKTGNPNNFCHECPIALALKERFKVNYVYVSYDHIKVGQFPDEVFVNDKETPEDVLTWMINFDQGRDVSPFSFELELGEQQ